ncbi:MAG TPA: flagellar basal-body MS-ring/collar protein FliF, partial [Chloroflexota bacterium]|nr:flagellar basal-body MS-ring/collar protein FliF [Chloroflexota bacterium]
MLPLLERIRDQWQRLPTNRRIGLLVIVVGIIGTVVLWGVMSSQVTYAVAFSDLQPADASAVASKLGELQIPYQLEDGTGGTTTIRVPASLVSEARVQVAGAGILKGSGVGYEIFNQPSFGLSDFIQQVDYQRALEGELARSISQIDGIDSARVHLAIPQPSVFLAQQRDPSAAVVISLKPGYQIDRAHAQAIVDLVVGAVQGMKASQVVLLDTSGNLLHQTQDSTGGNLGALDDHFAVQQSLERNLTSQLQDMLDRVVGPGHSTVQVNVQLDWTSGDTTTDIYSPNGQQPQLTSDQELKEYLPPGSGSVGGVATSLPTYQSITTTAALTSTNTSANGIQREQSNRTFQLSHTIQKTQLAPGTISRVSVAIAVDSNVADTT